MIRLHADLIMMYKLTHNIVSSSFTNVLYFTNDASTLGVTDICCVLTNVTKLYLNNFFLLNVSFQL